MVFEKRIQQAFLMFDADRSGKLDRAEVRNAMRILGCIAVETRTPKSIARAPRKEQRSSRCRDRQGGQHGPRRGADGAL